MRISFSKKDHARFLAKTERVGSCLEWRAHRDREGYGSFWLNGKTERAHRVMFFFKHGYFPKEVEHLCDNPSCVRPKHLRDATHVENMSHARNFQREKTHCVNGHEYTDENTYRDGSGWRQCRACKSDWQKGRVAS